MIFVLFHQIIRDLKHILLLKQVDILLSNLENLRLIQLTSKPICPHISVLAIYRETLGMDFMDLVQRVTGVILAGEDPV
jgi:hypothetical protein